MLDPVFKEWWEREGINLSHHDACAAAYTLGTKGKKMQIGLTFPNQDQAIIKVADGAAVPHVGELLHMAGDVGTDGAALVGSYRVASRMFQVRMGDRLHGPTSYGWHLQLEDDPLS